MENQEYEVMFRVEDVHWWYSGMERITRALLDRYIEPRTALNILDAGCGTGRAMAALLAEYGAVTGIDFSAAALGFCKQRNLQRLTQASVTRLPFQSCAFDLVTSFDVLYEQAVESDLEALREFFRVLKPGGSLLLRLPAYDWLRGQHDIAVHTARRYTLRRLAPLLDAAGLKIVHASYANTLLFLPAAFKRLSERFVPSSGEGSDLTINPGAFNNLLKEILALEAPLVSHSRLPFGLSVFAVCRKTEP